MRRPFYQQCILLAVGLALLSGCFGGARERLQSLAGDTQEIWVPAVVNAGPPAQQSTAHLTMVGQIGGQMKGVAVQGDYAYVGVGPRLVVLDLSEPTRPTMAGQTAVLPNLVQSVSVNGNYAYVTTEAGEQRVIDIADPAMPKDITDAGMQSASSLAAVRSALPNQAAQAMTVVDSLAYVTVEGGLRVVDIAAGRPPRVLASLDLPQPIEHLAVANDFVYVAAGQSGLKIIDASNPAQLVEIGDYTALDAAVDIQVEGNVAYVVDPWSGLHLIDVRNPAAPSEIGQYDTPGLTSNVFVANNNAYLVDQRFGLYVVGVGDGSAPVLQGVYAAPQTALAAVVSPNQVAYLAAEADGLWVIDLTNPTNPVPVKQIKLPEIAGGLALADGFLYVAAGESGLHIFDIADPFEPKQIRVYDDLDYARDVDIAGKFAYIADEWSGLHIIDITDPAQPIEAATLEVGAARGVKVAGNFVYVAADEADLRVFDISDPYTPREAPEYAVPGDANGVAVKDNYAYIAAGGSGLQIVSLAGTPGSVVGEWAGDYGRNLALVGHYVYLATEQAGVDVINVASPPTPELVERFDTIGSAIDIYGSGEYVYVADGVGGFLVLKTRPDEK